MNLRLDPTHQMYDFAPLLITTAFVGPPFVPSPFLQFAVNLVPGRAPARGNTPIRVPC